ncbi:MAG: hypothetical protein AB1515_07210 [Nitrospirota bacterium]
MTPTTKLDAQFNRTRISEDDFSEAEDYLSAIRPKQDITIQRALLLAAIVAYARPFTKNKDGSGDRSAPYLQASPTKMLTPEEQLLHRKLINLRDEALAHSQYDRKAVRRTSGSAKGFVMQGRLFDILSENIDRGTFHAICSKMKRHCNNKLFALNRKLSNL